MAGTTKPPVNQPMDFPLAPTSSLGDKMQRKRAAKACDQCRRRKSRCDGQMDCSACRTIGLQCSYGHQVKQSRGSAYITHLEKKVQMLEGRVRQTSSASEQSNDVEDPSNAKTSSPLGDSDQPLNESRGRSSFSSKPFDLGDCSGAGRRPNSIKRVDSMESSNSSSVYVETITTQSWGKVYGNDILRQLFNFCNQIATSPASPQSSSTKIVQALNSLQNIFDLSTPSTGNPLLPAKPITLKLIEIALTEAFHLWPFVDRTQVGRTVYRLYSTDDFGQEADDKEELGLVYAMLALGERFGSTTATIADSCRTQGLAYFAAANKLLSLSNCDRNLAAVQTVLCLALFLKAAAAPAQAHSYLAAAASAALRLRLHENLPGFSKDESALRRRVWSTITAFDIYISTQLGIPRSATLDEDEQDPYPPLSSGSNAELVASDAHLDMLRMFSCVITKTYCSRTACKPSDMGAYVVDQQIILGASDELDRWAHTCPVLFQAADDMTHTQRYLAYAYDYAQLLLHSPFVHHIAIHEPDRSSQPYALGLKAVDAALHAIQIAEILHKQHQFNEAYFLTIDVLIHAAIVLLVVEVGSSDDALVLKAMRAGRAAMQLLLVLSLRSSAASQCWEALAVRSSKVAGRGNGSLSSNVSSVMRTGPIRRKAPGTISIPPNELTTLYQADSAKDTRFVGHGA